MDKLKGIKGIIFDLDGTLVDSMDMWERIDNNFLESLGIAVPEDYAKKIAHMGLKETAQYTKKRFSLAYETAEIIAIWFNMALHEYQNNVFLKEGAYDFLKLLRARKIELAIASASKRELVMASLKKNNILDFFKVIVTVDDVNKNKEFPDIYFKALELLNQKQEEVYVFEDILLALKTAKKAGFKTVAVYDFFSSADSDKIKEVSDIYIKSFKELL